MPSKVCSSVLRNAVTACYAELSIRAYNFAVGGDDVNCSFLDLGVIFHSLCLKSSVVIVWPKHSFVSSCEDLIEFKTVRRMGRKITFLSKIWRNACERQCYNQETCIQVTLVRFSLCIRVQYSGKLLRFSGGYISATRTWWLAIDAQSGYCCVTTSSEWFKPLYLLSSSIIWCRCIKQERLGRLWIDPGGFIDIFD